MPNRMAPAAVALNGRSANGREELGLPLLPSFGSPPRCGQANGGPRPVDVAIVCAASGEQPLPPPQTRAACTSPYSRGEGGCGLPSKQLRSVPDFAAFGRGSSAAAREALLPPRRSQAALASSPPPPPPPPLLPPLPPPQSEGPSRAEQQRRQGSRREGRRLSGTETPSTSSSSTQLQTLLRGAARLVYRQVTTVQFEERVAEEREAEGGSCSDAGGVFPSSSSWSQANTTRHDRSSSTSTPQRRRLTASSSASSSTLIGSHVCGHLLDGDFDDCLFLEESAAGVVESSCRRCCPRSWCQWWTYYFSRKPPMSVDLVFRLLSRVAGITDFPQEVVVLGVVYVERLVSNNPALRLTITNWRPILVAALLLASKIWEDVHPWNIDFSQYLRQAVGIRYPPRSLYALESKLLAGLGYRAGVTGELYANYYFALQDAGRDESEYRTASVQERDSLAEEQQDPGRPGMRARSCDCRLLTPRKANSGGSGDLLTREEARAMLPRAASSPFMSGGACEAQQPRGRTRERWESEVGAQSRQQLQHHLLQMTSTSGGAYPRRRGATSPSPNRDDPEEGVDNSTMTSIEVVRHLRRIWRLDARNPYVGTFRHAPRAAPPESMVGMRSLSDSGGGLH